MLSSKFIIEKIEENVKDIKKYGVEKIGLFGSYAKNNQNSKSDIDILVRFRKKEKTFDNYMELKFFLESLFKHEVDLVLLEAIKPDLKQYILESVIYAARV